jgi:hypothetical protein
MTHRTKPKPLTVFGAALTALIFCVLPAHAQTVSDETRERISRYTAPAEHKRPAPVPLDKPKPTLEQVATPKIAKNPYDNYLSLSYENDLIGEGDDRYYTNGVRLTWYGTKTNVPRLLREVGDEFPILGINDTTATYFTIGQNMYTPADIGIAADQPNDRPWAGWLYGSVGLTSVNGNHMDDFEVTLGVVGPPALAEQTQKFIHRHVTDSDMPKGWGNQLKTEPGIILSWQRRWPSLWTLDFDYSDLRLAAAPNVNVSLGNIYTYAGTGMTFTFGPYQKSLQDVPPRVRPAMAGTGYFDVPDQNWGWYLFAGVDGRAVARNIFLDGNSFRDSASIDKKPFVADAFAGIAISIYDYRLAYTYNWRSQEFDGQDEPSTFGSLSLTARF